jgi:hypothetical protein
MCSVPDAGRELPLYAIPIPEVKSPLRIFSIDSGLLSDNVYASFIHSSVAFKTEAAIFSQ